MDLEQPYSKEILRQFYGNVFHILYPGHGCTSSLGNRREYNRR